MSFQQRSEEDLLASLSVALQPSTCGRRLVRHVAPDEPFFYLGDTAWELFHRLNDDEAEMFLRNRQSKGFNSVMVVVLAEHGGLDFPNREGHWPFFPSSESTPERYVPDLNRPNPGYFDFIDRVVRLAAKLDITITLVPTWGRYVNGGYHGKPILFNTDNAYSFCRFLGDRYPFHPFVLGGDSVRYWNPKTMEYLMSPDKDVKDLEILDFGDITEAMAKGLVEGESEGKRRLKNVEAKRIDEYQTLITFHSCQTWFTDHPEASASAQFPDASWLNWDCVQTGHFNGAPPSADAVSAAFEGGMAAWKGSAPYEPIRKMYNTPRPDGRNRPVIDLEPHYEATHHWFNLERPLWTADDIRTGAWQSIFAGACGYTYGCNSIWQMHNAESKTHPPINPPTTAYTNWYLELDLSGAFYVSLLRRFFLSLPNYFSYRPDSSFILSERNDPEDGSSALDKLISGLKADGWVMVHLPYGGAVTVDIISALGKSSGQYRAWWVDPKTGGKASLNKGKSSLIEEESKRVFESPTEGSKTTDWVLLLETYSIRT